MNKVSLIEIFKHIDQNSEYSVLYRSDQLEKIKPISINLQNTTVEEILNECLQGTGFLYQLNDKTIVISKQLHQTTQTPQQGMREIRGTIVDTKKTPLPGATIMVKGTSIGVTSNEKGEFTIKIPNDVKSLTITFIGFKSKEVLLGANNTIKIVLEEDIVAMDDVVVTGFFNKRKDGFAGSVTTIKKADLQKLSTGNIFTTISTIDAGFKINEDNINGANPNKLPDFTIRGKGSFQNGSTTPLFILDGFEVSAEKIFDMDVNRIETITLLKDASATILYGSRAANGVIVIETTAPKAGQLRVTYDFKPSIALADLTGYDLMDAQEKLEYERLAGMYDHTTDFTENQKKDTEYYKKYKNILEGVDTYWLSKPIHSTFSHAHSLFVEGGVDNVRYGIDASYNKQEGVMKSSGRDRTGLGFSLIYRIKDKITIKNYISYAHTYERNSPYGEFSTYGIQNPYERIHDDKGELLPILLNGESNPLYDAELPSRDNSKSQEFREQLSADWMINDGFRLRGQIGINKSNYEKNKYTSPLSSKYVLTETMNEETGIMEFTPIEKRGELSIGTGNGMEVSANVTLNYNKMLAEKHLLYAGLGGELNTSNSSSNGYIMTGFPDDRYSDPAFAIQYKENTKASSNESKNRSIGLFGNLNYIYDNRYFLDASLRYDGSSRFGSDNKFAPFWSLGAGWNIHNEKFWFKNSLIDLFKLRYSYGITGNQEFSAYQAKTMYQFQTERLLGSIIPSTIMGYGNPDLKWQKQYQSNIGLDFGMAQNRVRATFNYYHKRTEGMLTSITVAPSIGLPNNSFTANLGKIKNIGYELNLNGIIIRQPEKDLEWAVFFQGAHNENTLVEISNQLKGINSSNNDDKVTPGAVYEEGQSMTAIKAVQSLGIDPVTGQEIFVKKDGSLTYMWDAADKILCGDSEPKFFGNVGTNLFWKGWNLNMVFKYSFGADYYNQTLASRVEGADPRLNADRRVLNNRWKNPGDHALYKNIKEYTTTFISTRFVQRENMIQLGSLSLSYDFKKEWLNKYRINTLRLSFYANDLFRASTIKEERGLSYPFQRSYVFGLNIGF
ncbi:MAG: SusC/RagA family TonB-linked outer membrane protein [Odoribacter sp.]